MTIVFCDTETTGLNPDDQSDIWEFAAVRRESNGMEMRFHTFVDHDVAQAATLPEPFLSDYRNRFNFQKSMSREDFQAFGNAVFGRDENGKRPHLVGAVPDFDTAGLRRLMGVSRSASPWHYHIIDVETLIVGYLRARQVNIPMPWNSDDLSRLIGVDATRFDRHTAMGDALWTMANYDAVMH